MEWHGTHFDHCSFCVGKTGESKFGTRIKWKASCEWKVIASFFLFWNYGSVCIYIYLEPK